MDHSRRMAILYALFGRIADRVIAAWVNSELSFDDLDKALAHRYMWTSEPPTMPGWYWFDGESPGESLHDEPTRPDGTGITTVLVRKTKDIFPWDRSSEEPRSGLVIAVIDDAAAPESGKIVVNMPIECFSGKWAGPIEMPQ